MKEGHVRSLFPNDRERREIVTRALSGARMIGMRGNNHVKIYIEGDGMVTTANSGGGRGSENFESQLRRAHRSVNSDFPRLGESVKAFQRRLAKNRGSNNEQQ